MLRQMLLNACSIAHCTCCALINLASTSCRRQLVGVTLLELLLDACMNGRHQDVWLYNANSCE